jgi:hypothetical protein
MKIYYAITPIMNNFIRIYGFSVKPAPKKKPIMLLISSQKQNYWLMAGFTERAAGERAMPQCKMRVLNSMPPPEPCIGAFLAG